MKSEKLTNEEMIEHLALKKAKDISQDPNCIKEIFKILKMDINLLGCFLEKKEEMLLFLSENQKKDIVEMEKYFLKNNALIINHSNNIKI